MKKIFLLLIPIFITALAVTGCTQVVQQPTQQEITPADISLTDFTVTPQQVAVNQKVQLQLRLINNGDLPGNYYVQLFVDDVPKIQEYISVDGNTIKPVVYSVAVNTPGTYTVSIEEREATFTVVGAAP